MASSAATRFGVMGLGGFWPRRVHPRGLPKGDPSKKGAYQRSFQAWSSKEWLSKEGSRQEIHPSGALTRGFIQRGRSR